MKAARPVFFLRAMRFVRFDYRFVARTLIDYRRTLKAHFFDLKGSFETTVTNGPTIVVGLRLRRLLWILNPCVVHRVERFDQTIADRLQFLDRDIALVELIIVKLLL